MRSLIILFIIVSIGSVSRGQLNFKGNPLTENTDYTAEETRFTERNANSNYENFENTDSRKINSSNDPSASSSSDNVVNSNKEETSKKLPPVESQPSDLQNSVSIESSKESMSERNSESLPQGRQLVDYSVPSMPISPYRSSSSQESYESNQQSQHYTTFNQPSLPVSHLPSASSPMSLASAQALNKFLQSKTPEESQIALRNYLKIRDYAARMGIEQSGQVADVIADRSSEEKTMDIGSVSNDGSNRDPSYFLMHNRGPQAMRWNQLGSRVRQDSLPSPGRRPPIYRGHTAAMNGRQRGNPWSQPRISSGGPDYNRRGSPVFSGPPIGPPGKWKGPVKVIYTKPPGFGHGPPPNSPIPYQDASQWFPDADGDQPPPQKDVLYSQLYAQSYDPHYYNYIAKTGKIKPWLYGKLGEHKEKSIWWELFAGFKKHGMKNIMNPMFLLGMTIPTLTFMLTALVQKRSLGRSFSDGLIDEDTVEEYARRLREAIECNEKRIKDNNNSQENMCW